MIKIINYKNKFKILYKQIKAVTGVYFELKFKAGGYNDPKGKGGTAHFCEHALMGFSTKNRTRTDRQKDLYRFVEMNARTSYHYVSFYVRVPNTQIEEAVDRLTDPFANLLYLDSEFEAEKKIIQDEIVTRVKTNIATLSLEQRRELSKNPEIVNCELSPAGSKESLAKITLKDIKNYIDSYFNKDNMTIVVTGNISIKKLKKLIDKYVEPRIKDHGKIGFSRSDFKGYKDKKYFYLQPVEKDKGLMCLLYFYGKRDMTKYMDRKYEEIIRILSVCLNEILFVFIRTKKELCYGSSIDVLNHNIYQATDVYLECQDDKISEVIEAYKEFYQTLPEDLDKGVFDRQKEKLENLANFDLKSTRMQAGILFSQYDDFGNIIDDDVKYTKKLYDSISYDDVNREYKKCFSVKPVLFIMSQNEKFKDFDYQGYVKEIYKKGGIK